MRHGRGKSSDEGQARIRRAEGIEISTQLFRQLSGVGDSSSGGSRREGTIDDPLQEPAHEVPASAGPIRIDATQRTVECGAGLGQAGRPLEAGQGKAELPQSQGLIRSAEPDVFKKSAVAAEPAARAKGGNGILDGRPPHGESVESRVWWWRCGSGDYGHGGGDGSKNFCPGRVSGATNG